MNPGLYFVVGALVVAVVDYVLFGAGGTDSPKDVNIEIESPTEEYPSFGG